MTTRREVSTDKDIFDAIELLNGGGFVSLKDYTNGKGETADYVFNGNVNSQKHIENALLHGCTEDDLTAISNSKGIALDLLKTALNKLTMASDKNCLPNKEDRSAQSQAQDEIYEHFGKGFKMHSANRTFKILGFLVSKNVTKIDGQPVTKEQAKIVKEHKEDTRRELTKAQDEIKYFLKFKSTKTVMFTLGISEFISLSGMTVSTEV